MDGGKEEADSPTSSDVLENIFSYIDNHKSQFIEDLRTVVSIRSISSWPHARAETVRMIQWTGEKLKQLGGTVQVTKTGMQGDLELPPVLMASFGDTSNPGKKTLLIYAHLDVQPAKKEDGWTSDPFLLVEWEGQLYGRGATDDKGPLLGWLHAVEAFIKCHVELPINIKFVLSSMEESGTESVMALLRSQKEGFLSNIDGICISDNYWLQGTPCLTQGFRGLSYFFIEIEMGDKDLHSGVFGGVVYECMNDMVYLLNTLVSDDHSAVMAIPGLMDTVQRATDDELQHLNSLPFDPDMFEKDTGAHLKQSGDKVQTLLRRWRLPSLSIHGIQGDFCTPGAKTIIPRKLIGKFSIRTVPNMDTDAVDKCVMDYVQSKWTERKSPNSMKIYPAMRSMPFWEADTQSHFFKSAELAMTRVYGKQPLLVREGGTIPIVVKLEEIIGKKFVLLPLGRNKNGVHSHNESLDIKDFLDGTKVMAAYFEQLGRSS